MNEVDDRLAGDPVWELFPYPAPGPEQRSGRHRHYRRWLVAACLLATGWFLVPSLAVVTACLAVAVRDFRRGRQLARAISDKAGGAICARFTYAWGAWKVGGTAFGLMFVGIPVFAAMGGRGEAPVAIVALMLLGMGGFMMSAALTASGLVMAYRSGMRIWIGEGVNRARTLLLEMLVVGFTVVILIPMIVVLCRTFPHPGDYGGRLLPVLPGFLGCWFAAPFIMLLILDWISRRVVADCPGKFGPKVPTVGKWNS